MGRIVAIGGKDSPRIYKYICGMSQKEKPNFLFVATASSDNPAEYAKTSMAVGEYGCETRPLYLLKRKYTKAQLDEIFSWADIIYVCGGDTLKCVETWIKYGIDKYMKDVFEKDSAILCGTSAGGICWFKRGFSDSSRTPEYGKHGWVSGIGIFPEMTFCPHFGSRGDAYREALRDSGEDGIALEDYTAYVYDNGREGFIRHSEEYKVYVFSHEGGELKETRPESAVLG